MTIELYMLPQSNRDGLRASFAALAGVDVQTLQVEVSDRRVTISSGEDVLTALGGALVSEAEAVVELRRRERIWVVGRAGSSERRAFHEGRSPQRRDKPRAGLSWVHLSDIHVGHGDAGHRAHQGDVLDSIIADAAIMARDYGSPDFIFVTGDVAFSAQPAQYLESEAWLRRFCAAVGVGPSCLFMVPGNHDVDRSYVRARPHLALIHTSRDGFAGLSAAEALDSMLSTQEAELTGKFSAFAAAKARLLDPGSGKSWWFEEHEHKLGPLLLAGLNTALGSCDNNDKDHLPLGQVQLSDTLQPARLDGRLAIVLAHHPPDWLKDGERLLNRLAAVPHVLLTGHVHRADGHAGQSLVGGGHLQLSAGAVHDERHALQEHGYSWTRLDPGGLSHHRRRWTRQYRFESAAREDERFPPEELPRALRAWLDARPPSMPHTPVVPAAQPATRAEARSRLVTHFAASQLDRKDQWDSLYHACQKRYSICFLAGPAQASLELFIERARNDLVRWVGQTMSVLHVKHKESERSSPAVTDEDWFRSLAVATKYTATDSHGALLGLSSRQSLLVFLGPIPNEIQEDHRDGFLKFLLRLAVFVDKHGSTSAHALRFVVLVEDRAPLNSREQPALVQELCTWADERLRPAFQAIVRMPRAGLPRWEEDILPLLDAYGADSGVRQKVEKHYRQLESDALDFEDFGTLLEQKLAKL